MLALNFVHLIIERASRYPQVPLIRKSIFARNDPFSHLRSHMKIIASGFLECGHILFGLFTVLYINHTRAMVAIIYVQEAAAGCQLVDQQGIRGSTRQWWRAEIEIFKGGGSSS